MSYFSSVFSSVKQIVAVFIFSTLSFFPILSWSQVSTIVVLGDSLSEGYGVAKEAAWPAVIETMLNRKESEKKWTVINAGVSGSTTASGIGRIKWLAQKKPKVVILALGVNDGLRGLKVQDSKKHLEETILFAQKEKMKVVLGGLYMPPNYGKEYTTEFRKMYEDLAKKYQLIFVPFVLDKVAGDPKYNLADGIHPNEAGHKIMAENIFKVIEGKL